LALLSLLGQPFHAWTAEPPLPSLISPPVERTAPTLPGFVLPPVNAGLEGDALPADGTQVLVKAVTFRGNTVFVDKALQDVVAPALGRKLGALEIEELRRKLTLLYVTAGYVNSGALLESAATFDGTLHFVIIEGTVSQVRLRGLERLDEGYVAYRLVPEPSAPLNIEHLRERYQLLLSDPLFAGINTRLVPDVAQGRAILDVEVTRATPVQLTLSTNNYRAPAIGENASSVTGLVRNLTGLGDALSLNWQGAGSERYGLNWSLPLNHQGTLLTVQADQGGSSVVEEPLGALQIKSQLSSLEVGLTHPFIETLSQHFALGTAWSDRTNRTSLLGVPFSFTAGIPAGVLKASTWKLWQDYTYRTESNVFAARVTYNVVSNNLLAPAPGSAGGAQPPTRYSFWVTQLNFSQRITEGGTQFQARATLQDSSTRLTALDGMSIGGVNTVRGFRENQILRDKGAIVNLEVNVPVLASKAPGALQLNLVPFVDSGTGQSAGAASSGLSSAGLAMRAVWGGLTLDLVLASRLQSTKAIDALNSTAQDRGIHFQLSYSVF
jgi:hemolysin activation/secretion protein